MATSRGFLLRLNRVRDYDAIITVYTDTGLRDLYCFNVFRPRSSRRNKLETMNLLNFSTSNSNKASNSLATVAEIELVSEFSSLKVKSDGYRQCFLLAEIIYKFMTQEELEPGMYLELTEVALASNTPAAKDLSSDAASLVADKILLYLSLRLLNNSGFLPELTSCTSTGKSLDPERQILPNEYDPGYRQLDTEQLDAEQSNTAVSYVKLIKVQNYICNCENIVQFHKLNLEPELVKAGLNIHLGWIQGVIGTELKSLNYD